MLKWLLNPTTAVELTSLDLVLSGTKKIDNITLYLESMKSRGYLRLLHDIDLRSIEKYMTETSWRALNDFNKKHGNDLWLCPICNNQFRDGAQGNHSAVSDSDKWKCARCLFYFHKKCLDACLVTRANVNGQLDSSMSTTFTLCFTCVFNVS